MRANSGKTTQRNESGEVIRVARRCPALPGFDRRNTRGSWSTRVADRMILGAAALIFSTLTGALAFAEQRKISLWL